MGRVEALLGSALGAIAVFIAVQAMDVGKGRHPSVGGGASTDQGATPQPPPATHGSAPRATAASIAARTFGTYLPEILEEQGSVLRRWPARGADQPLRVWVQPESGIEGWSARFVQPARDAVLTWDQAGLPMRLTLVPDSAAADVRVTWEAALPPPRIGVAQVESTPDGWIVAGTLRLAVHGPDGGVLPESVIRAVALHEVGHLLGLNHTSDTTAIMAPRATQLDRLAPSDLATARLLYSLPAGKVE